MRIARPAVVATLVTSTWLLLPGGPAVAGAYCRTLQDLVAGDRRGRLLDRVRREAGRQQLQLTLTAPGGG